VSRYRKIDPRIWNDEKFRTMSPGGKLVFMFFLTHPNLTALGAMRGTIPGLAAELGWRGKDFKQAFEEVFVKGMVRHDPEAACFLIPNFLKYNRPESPNVVKAWSASLDLIPECGLKVELIQRAKAFAEALPEAFREALPKSMPYQEQKQELEQEQEPPPVSPPRGTINGFEQFRTTYPKWVGTEKAEEAWKKARKKATTEEILGGLARTMGYITRDNGQYIPNPATWLNQGRWADEPTKTQKGAAAVVDPALEVEKTPEEWEADRAKVRELVSLAQRNEL